jgi:hypothetical protein
MPLRRDSEEQRVYRDLRIYLRLEASQVGVSHQVTALFFFAGSEKGGIYPVSLFPMIVRIGLLGSYSLGKQGCSMTTFSASAPAYTPHDGDPPLCLKPEMMMISQ